MTPADLLDVLQAFYRETLELAMAREASARLVRAYDANNAYQQILGRQDVHLRWLSDAIAQLGGEAPALAPQAGKSDLTKVELSSVLEADATVQRAFIDRWAPRVQTMTNARDRKLLQLILGEMGEHSRVFQQALEGRTDLLGRHSDGKVLRGEVMSHR